MMAMDWLEAAVPTGLLVRRVRGKLYARCADSEVAPAETWMQADWDALGAVGPGIYCFDGIRQLREFLRAQLLQGALKSLGLTRRGPRSVNGLTLARLTWEWITDPSRCPDHAPPAGTTPRRRTREALQQWAACVRGCPLPELPTEVAAALAGDRHTTKILWADDFLVTAARRGRPRCDRVPGFVQCIRDHLRIDLGWQPMARLTSGSNNGGDGAEQVERVAAADCAFLEQLDAGGQLEQGGGRYHGVRMERTGPGRVRLTVEFPEHIAELPKPGAYVHWGAARGGTELKLGASYGVNASHFHPHLTLRTWDDSLWFHPIVHHQLDADGGREICIADSAANLSRNMAARRVTHPGAVVAETLLCLRRGVLYGVHAGLRGPVFHPYQSLIDGGDLPYPVLDRDQALALAQQRHLEIVPWNR